MSFSFTARGPKYQVLDSLRSLDNRDFGGDGFGEALRDTFVDFLEDGSDPGPNQVYAVSCSGHSSEEGLVTLTASIQLENATPEAAAQMAAQAREREADEQDEPVTDPEPVHPVNPDPTELDPDQVRATPHGSTVRADAPEDAGTDSGSLIG